MRMLQAAITAAIVGAIAAAPTTRATTSKLKWLGINESGAEFGTAIPGTLGTDYTWYNKTTFDTFISKGVNIFRINFLMERLTPSLTGSFNAAYLAALKQNVEYATSKHVYTIICPHNYGRFNGAVITDTAGFKTWWKNVAAEFRNNKYVIFDTNNEYHDMSSSLVVSLNQAAIDGIRAAGATTQFITPEGNAYTGAWTWTTATGTDGVTNANSMGKLTDPKDRLIYQMHQYLDSDGSGTSENCVSSTVGQERLVAATNWLRANKKKALIGEFAGGANQQCLEAVNGMLSYMKSNTDVWKGAVWWAAGPWWGGYMYNMEPTGGVAYSYYLNDLLAHR